jgi:hypothetical protein
VQIGEAEKIEILATIEATQEVDLEVDTVQLMVVTTILLLHTRVRAAKGNGLTKGIIMIAQDTVKSHGMDMVTSMSETGTEREKEKGIEIDDIPHPGDLTTNMTENILRTRKEQSLVRKQARQQ